MLYAPQSNAMSARNAAVSAGKAFIARPEVKWMQSTGSGVKAAIAGKADAKTALENTTLMATGDIAKFIQAVDRPPAQSWHNQVQRLFQASR